MTVPVSANVEDAADALLLLNALVRDTTVQLRTERDRVRNGLPKRSVPLPSTEVLESLAAVAGVELGSLGSDSGTSPDSVVNESAGALVSVPQAAGLVGKSEAYIRRLARTGRIRGQRVGDRVWLVDLESLQRVLERTAA